MATYKSSKELEGKILKGGDCLEFCVKGEILVYRVYSRFLIYDDGLNSQIFQMLGIEDRFQYAKKYYQEAADFEDYQSFPGCKPNSYEALTRLAIALFKDCEKLQKETKFVEPSESIYKVGDKVRVKSAYDPGCSSGDYPCGFISTMLEDWGGTVVTICKVNSIVSDSLKDQKQYLEPFTYKVSGNNWSWSAAMFEGKVEDTPTEDTSAQVPIYPKRSNDNFYFTKEDIPVDCPYHPYVIDQAIQEWHDINSLSYADALKRIQQDSKDVSAWFNWEASSQGFDYWENIYYDPSYCPKDYTPVFYRETVDKKKLSTEISQPPSTFSYEIPCSYEEVTLSIKKPKIFF